MHMPSGASLLVNVVVVVVVLFAIRAAWRFISR